MLTWIPLAGMTLAVVLIGLIAGLPALNGKAFSAGGRLAGVGEALSVGVFLGAGLIHLLADAAADYQTQGVDYPWPFLLAGVMVLALACLEQYGRARLNANGNGIASIAVLATAMLTIHSFLAGAALSVSKTGGVALLIFLAILAHKWAAAFALALMLSRSPMSIARRHICFLVFVAGVPAGVIAGALVRQSSSRFPLLEPTLLAFAAGTFIYLGTLHGLSEGPMVRTWRTIGNFLAIVLGFTIMAVVAIWV
ncbi:ZIP family metal transporter [Roseibium sp. RKSG952]|uniref:ZIP family metal transporter n=1 Tax=Roseibium sp. RKSG952 TaxID=2529384 RepID=UPI0012BC9E5A|nr:ZIP family metal transporter [Roseibium sp. RKSG952]MTH96317.1 zinc transporter [Roseibium sp. RKSG952]